ncbi:hypothetical protein [Elioraea sp.]|uniref:hypothetical protein n=1 Tax=Elioraea sp. TaxID=2185103 RepID=UPI0025BCCA71|nr:hypothetical protein [Elioraea sp.]
MADPFSALRQGAELASTVSMAIPPPAGPFVMVGLQIFAMLLPTPPAPDKDKIILDAIAALPDQIGNAASLGAAKARLAAIKSGVDLVLRDWESAKGSDYEANALAKAKNSFNAMLQVGTDPVKELNGLLDVAIADAAGYAAGVAAVSAYMNLLLGLVIARKVIVELSGGIVAVLAKRTRRGDRSAAAELRKAKGDLRADYDDLVNFVNQYCGPDGDERKTCEAFIAALRKKRSDVLEVKTDGSNSYWVFSHSEESHYILDPIISDQKQHMETDELRFHPLPPGSTRGNPQPYWICKLSSVQAALEGYRNTVLAQFDTDMASVRKIYAQLHDQVDQASDLAPQPPRSAISVAWTDVGVAGYWNVAKGNAVAWGVQFQHGDKTSPIVWSPWEASPGGTAVPRLTVPCDETTARLTQTRVVYRIVRESKPPSPLPPTHEPPDEAEVALMLPDNVTERVIDTVLDATLGLPPVPALPPLVPPPVAVVPPKAPPPQATGASAGAGKRYCFAYCDADGKGESPIGPETDWLDVPSGASLLLAIGPNDLKPRLYARGRADTKPSPSQGELKEGDQFWTWTCP